jgi:hypothetical protein
VQLDRGSVARYLLVFVAVERARYWLVHTCGHRENSTMGCSHKGTQRMARWESDCVTMQRVDDKLQNIGECDNAGVPGRGVH